MVTVRVCLLIHHMADLMLNKAAVIVSVKGGLTLSGTPVTTLVRVGLLTHHILGPILVKVAVLV